VEHVTYQQPGGSAQKKTFTSVFVLEESGACRELSISSHHFSCTLHLPLKRRTAKNVVTDASRILLSTPEGRAALEQEKEIMRESLALHKLRQARGVTQVDLAKAWDTSQTNVSRMEHERDIYLSTLRRGLMSNFGDR